MGKPIQIFKQRKGETNVIMSFEMENDSGWWEER